MVVLFEFKVDVLGRQILIAVAPVRFAEPNAKSFGLIQFGGREKEEHLRVEAGFGFAAPQVPQEHFARSAGCVERTGLVSR